jgi:hypothetical protein
MKIKLWLLVCFMLFALIFAFKSDDWADLLQKKFNSYFFEKADTNLFIHTDKNIYYTNENIWFKAYIFSKNNLQSEVLFLRLVDSTQKIILEKKFPVYDVRSHGEIQLPDTLRQGKYLLYAFTDHMLNFNSNQVFTQQIEIKKANNNFLDMVTAIKDTAGIKAGGLVNINFKVKLGKERVQKAKIFYQIKAADHQIFKEDKVITDFTGNASLDFIYPNLNPDEHIFISGSVTNEDKKTDFNIELPNYHHFLNVSFYSEGGNLTTGLNQMKVFTSDVNQKAIAAKVIIKEDGKPFAQFNTNLNGLAFPKLRFKKESNYRVEVITKKHLIAVDFPLAVDEKAYQISFRDKKAQKSILINSFGKREKVFLVLRSNSQLLMTKELDFSSTDSLNIPLVDIGLTKSIVEVSLFNQQSEILAQRMFYQNVKDWYNIQINFDKKIYTTRAQFKGEIVITNNENVPVEANLSVAIVAESTVNPAFFNRIDEDYFAQLNKTDAYLPSNYADYNDYLIGKHWQNANWEQVLNYNPTGTFKLFKNAGGLLGQIEHLKGKPITVKELYLFDKDQITDLGIDENGSFQIHPSNLITKSNNKPYLLLGNSFFNSYNLKINSYATVFDNRVSYLNLKKYFRDDLILEPVKKFNSSMLNNTTVLNEVVVKAKKYEVEYNSNIYKSTNCMDYVCFNNVLNCGNHRIGGSTPVDGGLYQYGGRTVEYKGCASEEKKETNIALDNIFLPQTFYLPNYQQLPKEIKELATTLYWNPNLNTTKEGKALIEFYNSDVKGNFKIIIQGVDIQTLRPLFGQSSYLVSDL